METSVAVTSEQIKNKTGVRYRASGNLFIIKELAKTVPQHYQGTRGSVTGFSPGSGLRMRRYLRECIADYAHMVTLTYPGEYPLDGKQVKEHLRRFLQEVQRWDYREYKNTGPKHSAFWFMEFQERGAPHFHIFFNRCPPKKWVSLRWYDIVGSEDNRHLAAGTRTEKLIAGRAGTISYASKYAAKAEQKVIPPGYENAGRFWGVYGCRATMSADTFVSRTDMESLSVKHSVDKLNKVVKDAIEKGKCEVLKRESGIFVCVVHEANTMRILRFLTSAIEMKTMSYFDHFSDAELDRGDYYYA